MIRRTLLSSLLALLLVAAPAAALPFGLDLAPAGWLATAWDGFLGLFTVEKSRGQNDPNGQPQSSDDVEWPIVPRGVTTPETSVGPGTA